MRPYQSPRSHHTGRSPIAPHPTTPCRTPFGPQIRRQPPKPPKPRFVLFLLFLLERGCVFSIGARVKYRWGAGGGDSPDADPNGFLCAPHEVTAPSSY